MMFTFTPEEAIQQAQAGLLEEWVHTFLTTEGSNSPLSTGLKLQTRWWLGPLRFSLALLERCCGPEAHMEYREPLESFEQRVAAMMASLKQAWQPPPLIIMYTADRKLSIRDGSHRHEALIRSGYGTYWAIFWFNCEQDKQEFLDTYALL